MGVSNSLSQRSHTCIHNIGLHIKITPGTYMSVTINYVRLVFMTIVLKGLIDPQTTNVTVYVFVYLKTRPLLNWLLDLEWLESVCVSELRSFTLTNAQSRLTA